MAKNTTQGGPSGETPKKRRYPKELKEEAVQMVLDGHDVADVAERLGLSSVQLLYRWRKEQLGQAGVVGETLEGRVKELQQELQRVERERDILKKALAIFGRDG